MAVCHQAVAYGFNAIFGKLWKFVGLLLPRALIAGGITSRFAIGEQITRVILIGLQSLPLLPLEEQTIAEGVPTDFTTITVPVLEYKIGEPIDECTPVHRRLMLPHVVRAGASARCGLVRHTL
jgi:hypothetical protein